MSERPHAGSAAERFNCHSVLLLSSFGCGRIRKMIFSRTRKFVQGAATHLRHRDFSYFFPVCPWCVASIPLGTSKSCVTLLQRSPRKGSSCWESSVVAGLPCKRLASTCALLYVFVVARVATQQGGEGQRKTCMLALSLSLLRSCQHVRKCKHCFHTNMNI